MRFAVSSVAEQPNPFEQALFVIYLAVLVWAPLPFASNREWGGALLALLLFSLLCGWLLLRFFRSKRRAMPVIPSTVWVHVRLPLALLVLVQLWVFLQIQFLPRPLVEFLSPQAYSWHIKEGWLSLSLDREYGKYYLLRGCAYTAGFFLAVALINTAERVKLVLQVLVFSGLFQAVYGAFMVLSGLELGFFVEKYAGRGVATGTFVNRNHLAGYLVMCLSAGTGLFLSQLATDNAFSWKERTRRWLRLFLSSKFRLRLYLAIMVVALVLTRSRTGNMAFFASLGLAGCVAVYAGRHFSMRISVFLASLFLVDMLILGKWFGFDKVLNRLEQTQLGLEARRWSNEYSLNYLADFPLTGSGGGSFYGVFPHYQAVDLSGFYQHAHNDYLEFALELGIPAAAVLASFVALALHAAWRLQRYSGKALFRGVGFAVTMSVIWAAIHSSTDFNLQIPANALTFVVIMALAFICRGLPNQRNSPKQMPKT